MHSTRPPATPEVKNGFSEERDKVNVRREKMQEFLPKCRKFAYNAYTLPPVFLTLYRNK